MKKGMPILHVRKPDSAPGEDREKAKKNPTKISKKKLIREYLCYGELSDCVLYRTCENLDVCQYGRRYISLTSEEQQ